MLRIKNGGVSWEGNFKKDRRKTVIIAESHWKENDTRTPLKIWEGLKNDGIAISSASGKPLLKKRLRLPDTVPEQRNSGRMCANPAGQKRTLIPTTGTEMSRITNLTTLLLSAKLATCKAIGRTARTPNGLNAGFVDCPQKGRAYVQNIISERKDTAIRNTKRAVITRVDARVSNRVDRLKSLGNAIVPQIAYEIMKAITAARLPLLDAL